MAAERHEIQLPQIKSITGREPADIRGNIMNNGVHIRTFFFFRQSKPAGDADKAVITL